MNSTSSAPGACAVPSKQEDKHLIMAEVVFGDPKQVNCCGVGICRLFPSNPHRSSRIPSIPAALYFLQGGGIELRLRRSDLPDDVFRKQFSSGFFRVQTALNLPRWLQNKMPTYALITIPSGDYYYRETATYLTIIRPTE